MKTFYYSDFRKHVIENVSYELETQDGRLDEEMIDELVHQTIENECIYYADCWAIVNAICPNDWSDLVDTYGPLTNITSLAFAVLYEKVQEDLNHDMIMSGAMAMLKARSTKANKDGQADLFNTNF